MAYRILFLCLFLPFILQSQLIVDQAPFVLTIDQVKNWTEESSLADSRNISTVDLQTRFEFSGSQLNSSLSNEMKVVFAPDGMGNLANYLEEQAKFNLYNFTHWSYIDKVIWFGGTSEQAIHIPSAPWVETAHRNGVEVYGNIFFAPTVFGGNSATVANFLERDADGNFIIAEKLKDVATFYGFDGWFINMETSTTSSNGLLMKAFMDQLQTVLPENLKVIWYDAMLLNGNVNWQNQLNSSNSTFFQDGNNLVSDAMFVNFFWSGSTRPLNSRVTSRNLNRSEFDVFTGVDLWPSRNQAPFESGGNKWMGDLHDSDGPITSLGLFVPNAIFDNPAYSTFRSENSEEQRRKFYLEERHLFGGLDLNPSEEDQSGFKGLSHWIPASSTLTELPFISNFNTGHGRIFSTNGAVEIREWHDIAKQDILPSWQFAMEGPSNLSTSFDFTKAYNGGSSLKIEGSLLSSNSNTLKLYKTKFAVESDSKIDLIYSLEEKGSPHAEVILIFSDNTDEVVGIEVKESQNSGWNIHSLDLSAYEGREIAVIGLRFSASETVENYILNLGQIAVYNGEANDERGPISNFSVSNQSVKTGTTVEFSSETSTGANSYSWSFPGGIPNSSLEENPTISYDLVGTYDVSLAVSNEFGTDTLLKTAYLRVDDNPIALFTESSKNIQVGESITFRNTSENSTAVSWFFEGGTPKTSTDDNPMVSYEKVGCFDVSLIASNASGLDTIYNRGHVSVLDDTAIDHTNPVGTGIITARAEINQAESKEKAFDNFFTITANTKWLDNGGVPTSQNPSWIQMQFPEAQVVNTLVIYSANDTPDRDPENFNLLASDDGVDFVVLKNWEEQRFNNRLEQKLLPFLNEESYFYYRLETSKNLGDISLTQIGEIEFRGPAGPSSIDELVGKDFEMLIYPNPSNGLVVVEGEFPTYSTLAIINSEGRNVRNSIPILSHTTQVELSSLPAGIYSLVVRSSERVLVSKQLLVE